MKIVKLYANDSLDREKKISFLKNSKKIINKKFLIKNFPIKKFFQ